MKLGIYICTYHLHTYIADIYMNSTLLLCGFHELQATRLLVGWAV